jgi:hypothetical protein
MKKKTTKKAKAAQSAVGAGKGRAGKSGLNHNCDWRDAAIKLAQCVVLTLQADGKIGVGSGMVMKVRDGKRIVERWDKDFHEALALIGIELALPPPAVLRKPKKAMARGKGRMAA